MAKKDFSHQRYGNMFDKFIDTPSNGQALDGVSENRATFENKQLTSKGYGDLIEKTKTKMLFEQRYGTMFDKSLGDSFIRKLNMMKALRKEYIKNNTEEDKRSIQVLDNAFVESVRRELPNYTFLTQKIDDDIVTFIFGSESLARECIKSNPQVKFKVMDFGWFTYFYDNAWKNIDNYGGLEDDGVIVFPSKKSVFYH